MDEKTLKALSACADRAAIENLLGIYCRAIDRLDVDLLRSVYHADGVDDHGAICANAHKFAERIIVTLREVCVYSMHSIMHAVIETDGDKATSEASYIGFHTIAAGSGPIENFFGKTYLDEQGKAGRLDQRHEYICGGRYLDVLHKRDGAWRIFRRKMTNEWAICRPETTVKEGVPGAFYSPGSRDRSDPVYQLTRC